MEEKIPIRATLCGLEIGETVVFPILQLKSVRTQASELGAIHQRQFRTHMDRVKRTVSVKRIA